MTRETALIAVNLQNQFTDPNGCLYYPATGVAMPRILEGIRLLREKIGRLHQEAGMLREYSTQVREVYQAQIEIRQNKIMKSLTIVTAIFLPLTLIAGWYGMNFAMPELQWAFGYPAVAVLCAAVAAFCLWFFKKKHYF